MTGLNLHNIAGNALAFINPWKDMTFTKKSVTWAQNSRQPVVLETSVSVKGKLQPANLQTLSEIGYNLKEYQYWRVYLNLDATQLDTIKQLGSDTFICDGLKYRITDKEDWIQNGWREAYCYVDEEVSNDGE